MDSELRKAAGTAVDVWDDTGTRHEDVVNAMNDLRKVLAKNANAAPEQEPVATDCTRIMREQGKPYPRTCPRCGFGPCVYSSTIVIAAPAPAPQREWVGLTDEQENQFVKQLIDCGVGLVVPLYKIIEKIDTALKEKNHG